jgi:hypothetical protein
VVVVDLGGQKFQEAFRGLRRPREQRRSFARGGVEEPCVGVEARMISVFIWVK